MNFSGYADHPIESIEDDSLKMSDYVNGLSDFIKCCETPMTIAIKGEWGSGKTSLMRMIQNNLTKKTAAKDSPKSTVAEQTVKDVSKDTVTEQTANNASEDMVAEQTANNDSKDTVTEQTANNVTEAAVTKQTVNGVPEEPVIIPVWFDTWKFSAMELGNQLAISMLGEILHALDCDSTTIRKMLGGIAKLTHATLPLVTEVFTGLDSLGEMLRGFLRVNEKEHYGTEIRELQNRFHDIIQRKIKREKARRINDQEFLKLTQKANFSDNANSDIKSYYFGRAKEEYVYNSKYKCLAADRVVIFIDDLDRIQPDKAVDLLEILKAFLDCPNCVFVLAIDFELVSLGVNIKYKNNLSAEKNKDFFDKMVQLPFTMPITNYDLESYIKNLNFSESDISLEDIKHFIEHSVGANPRKIKRIFNTYNLNRKNALNKFKDMNKEFVNMCVFVLACMQEHYPDFLTFLANNDFDRFVFEPFFQPDSSAVYLYNDIFKNQDNAYIKQQLEGLRRFISGFRKAFGLQNENTERILEEYKQKNKQRNYQQDFPFNDGCEGTIYRNKLRIQQTLIFKERYKLRNFSNLKANYDDFKKIIRLISVSNLGMVINPKLQDIADNKEWLKREFNIWFVKEITDSFDKREKIKWSILTPIKTGNGIKISDIIGYKKFTTDTYFNYKYEFKVHEEDVDNICVDLSLHIYPNDDIHKNNMLSLMGSDPLSLLKTPNIKMSSGELIYNYIDAIKIRNVDDDYSMGDDRITLILESISCIIEETLILFQNRIKKGADTTDAYKTTIIRILIDRAYIEDCCYGHDPFKDRIVKVMDKTKERPDINSFMKLLRDCLKEHPEQVSLTLLKEVFGNEVVDSLQTITE